VTAAEIKLAEMQKNTGSQKTLVNATLQLISGNWFQSVNTQNIKDQSTTHFCVQHEILLQMLFLCNEGRKIKPLCNTEK